MAGPIVATEAIMTDATLTHPIENSATRPGETCGDVVLTPPHLRRRLLAGIIDGLIAAGAGVIAAGILYSVDERLHLVVIAGVAVAAVYILLRDGIRLPPIHRRSVGKHAMELRAVRKDGRCLGLTESALRNWTLAIAPLGWALLGILSTGVVVAWVLALSSTALAIVEFLFVLFHPEGRRVGDYVAGTSVRPTTVVHPAEHGAPA
jgi:uncharacterized RDD family membrane protein YckC